MVWSSSCRTTTQHYWQRSSSTTTFMFRVAIRRCLYGNYCRINNKSSNVYSSSSSWTVRSLHQTNTTAAAPAAAPFTTQPLWKLAFPQSQLHTRWLATVTTASSNNNKNSNVFLDHMGTIFLSCIGLILAWLTRSYQNTQSRNRLRDKIESQAILDPIELDDLRTANTNLLTVAQFRACAEHVRAHWGQHPMTYQEFVTMVRQYLSNNDNNNNTPGSTTIQLGHLLDRVVLKVLQERHQTLHVPQPQRLWWIVLSLAVSGTPHDRMQALFDIYQNQQIQQQQQEQAPFSNKIDENSNDQQQEQQQFLHLELFLADLQATCQLVPDAQIVPIQHKQFPIQEYAVATPHELLRDNNNNPVESLDDFTHLLRSKAVCVWGECYHKQKQ